MSELPSEMIFQQVATNLKLQEDNFGYLRIKLKIGILTWTGETF